ncbi:MULTISPECIES: Coq4 family protein [unclassified Novosphingobium]|uniref:Coq4 family protein n=1 Tax=unclassified Novosphingobium TaxID=2644732 RepID=UPI000D3001FC|nr:MULTISPECIES: Coq4 family protein [unclassified Novosphingobium]PTR12701.1 ubiquinone biosynthesis protein COQ4 [Novosphingobium sp. GV055]PUB06485.1 ubiquinone biosynthesis protein COQ4 [Novosphingobium sp. GV061]PUB22536.1 ubiquinone biosynthesis protein COQ4 [Novosphingobium sp. GV079]PUB44561.1 ubiquinone biosynthesis protein COQ4 [Novosphingobium sp. GV027]
MEQRAGDFAALPLFDPAREKPRLRPLVAYRHFRRLMHNTENTAEVFGIFAALPWRGGGRAGSAFLATRQGHALALAEPWLPAVLDDHAALRRMPAGSLAQAYCDFMEAEGLTAQGLVEEAERFLADRPRYNDRFQWYMNRLRDVHDLLHVLTGYGRDALGEACVLAFTFPQQPAPGHLFIAWMAALQMKLRLNSRAPVLGAVREAWRRGKSCPRLMEQSIVALLPLPLEEARRRLGIVPGVVYEQAHAVWQAEGIDPRDLLKHAR